MGSANIQVNKHTLLPHQPAESKRAVIQNNPDLRKAGALRRAEEQEQHLLMDRPRRSRHRRQKLKHAARALAEQKQTKKHRCPTFLPFFFRWAAFPAAVFSFASSLMVNLLLFSSCSPPPLAPVNPAWRSLRSSWPPHWPTAATETSIEDGRIGCSWERDRGSRRCSPSSASSRSRSQHTHTNTHASKHAPRWSTPTSLSAVRNWRLSPVH